MQNRGVSEQLNNTAETGTCFKNERKWKGRRKEGRKEERDKNGRKERTNERKWKEGRK